MTVVEGQPTACGHQRAQTCPDHLQKRCGMPTNFVFTSDFSNFRSFGHVLSNKLAVSNRSTLQKSFSLPPHAVHQPCGKLLRTLKSTSSIFKCNPTKTMWMSATLFTTRLLGSNVQHLRESLPLVATNVGQNARPLYVDNGVLVSTTLHRQ